MAISGKVATVQGWQDASDIKPGDRLLDESGRAAPVISADTRMADSMCYELEFRDGTRITASADHRWPVREYNGTYRDTAASSEQLAQAGVTHRRPLTTGRTKATKGDVARWRTRATPTLDLPAVPLPIPPYLLGYWLGDGDSDGPRITIADDDLPSLEQQCETLGARVVSRARTHGRTFRIRFDLGWRASGLEGLRELGVLQNKHIPAKVFRSAEEQRRGVLQGIVDSDGYIESGTNRVEVCFTSERLARDTTELIRTLGLYPRVSIGDAPLNGRVVGSRYRIVFTAYRTDRVSRLPRKADRLGTRGKATPYSRVRTITAVTPVPPTLVTRIRVSGTGGTYLAGDGLVPVLDEN
ncbi:hypothetical protein GCM10009639_16280 [Kitasatospora putterlickiae]|uniref:DOD-type homing endonuclease domain-containing protein n=1 Tax=Kitasatospora putterlickiae TaxID=221725 RepID=A0ABN1XUY3_9ACTN